MRIHEFLISAAIGAILFTPIASTAQNSPSSVTPRATTPARTPFGTPAVNQQQLGQIQRTATCPTGCPLDPALSARLNEMDDKLQALNRAVMDNPNYPAVTQLRDQIAALQKRQDALDKRITDAFGLMLQLQSSTSPLVQNDARLENLINALKKQQEETKKTANDALNGLTVYRMSQGPIFMTIDVRTTALETKVRKLEDTATSSDKFGSDYLPRISCSREACWQIGVDRVKVVTWKK